MAAEGKSFRDDPLAKLWVQRSLEFQRAALIRSRTKEVPGGEIYVLRSKEINYLTSLIEEYSK